MLFLLQKTGAAKVPGGKGSAWQSVSIACCWTNLRSRISRGRFRSLVTRFTHNHSYRGTTTAYSTLTMHFSSLLLSFRVSSVTWANVFADESSISRFKSTMYTWKSRERYFRQPPRISNSFLFIASPIVLQVSPIVLHLTICFLFFFLNSWSFKLET